MRQLVVQRVTSAVVWAGGDGRCRVRGLVMGFHLVAAGGAFTDVRDDGGMGVVGVGGRLRVVCRCSGPSGGAGGGMSGWHCQGGMFCRLRV